MTKRRSGGRRGRDDLTEIIRSASTRIQAALAKVHAAQQTEGPQAVRLLAVGKAFQEFNESRAELRRELEADLKQARQLKKFRHCVEIERLLLSFDGLDKKLHEIKDHHQQRGP